MPLTTEFNKWCQHKTLIRIITVEKGLGHRIHVGNIIFVDEQAQNILFYDLDQKKNYNFSMNEIEDIQPYEPSKREDIKQDDVKQEKIQVKGASKKLKIDIREKMISLLNSLPDKELYAIIPLLQLLADKNKKEH